MPTASNGAVSLYYETDDDGVEHRSTSSRPRADDGETVVFLGDVGYGAWQWGWQHAGLTGPFETLVTDLRGAGRSDAPPGPYAVDDFVADVQAVLDDHGARRVHVVGAGLGGMVALELARLSTRPRSLALLGTAPVGADLTLDPLFGAPDDPDALESSLAAALSRDFLDAHPDAIEQIVEWRAAEDAPREAWAAQAAAVEAFDVTDRLYEIDTPALVLHGRDDAVWPVEYGRRLAENLPRGEFVGLDGGHLIGVERSRAVNDRLFGFFESA
ncbi:alpha/beta fold hydrolase [Haloplanus rubicundus]|uniref:Alpha/beta fold hydrolase n=1 Tax=Haloplanus rubicundus TaxID=1547898 RepID=A0A345E936_9EURY|nr:alpha/beta hydrolase [Haloplanus rubicundus]AXG08708.1 alpha/beta fold hydrolase [Haloplanus rubicundus]